jgi:CTP synthase (UTP-ammonia lyase)
MPSLALIGDYSAKIVAHRAIPRALELVHAAGTDVTWQWIRTAELRRPSEELARYDGIWVAPGSPYENTDGALAAIRFARETRRPFLGTCGGFQHALIEFARDVAGLPDADHAETNPHGPALVVAPLSCSLVEKAGLVRFVSGSLIEGAYGRAATEEGYHCNYGLNAAHRDTLERAGLRFTSFDAAGDVRAAELPTSVHPFFVGTLFQPERAALRGELPPLVAAFVKAASGRR